MQRRFWIPIAVSLALLAIGAGIATGDDDEHERREHEHRFGRAPAHTVSAESRLYRDECGSCHLAYPPGFLPAGSWAILIQGLDDHFGENAELPADELARIRGYLLDNAGGSRRYGVGRGGGKAPRITETPHFLHEHDEIPARMIGGNPQVVSLSRCDACHAGAARGDFDEHGVRIPGYGRWDD